MEKTKINDFDSLATSDGLGIFGDILADFASRIAEEASESTKGEDSNND